MTPELHAEVIDLPKHFPLMVDWWKERQFPPPDPRFLPPTGLVVLWGDTPVAGGFLFRTDAGLAVIGNLVADPKAPKLVRSPSIDYLILALADIAREDGFKMVCCSTNLARLMKRFQKLGFTNTDVGVSTFGRIF